MNFRLFNIPVIIQPTFWIFLLIFCFDPHTPPSQTLLLALIVTLSLLFHEYGHALAAQKLGRPPTITLENFGGHATYNGTGLPEKHHFIITLCGPLFTALLIALSHYLLKTPLSHPPLLNHALYYTTHLNTYWLIVNLAPLLPLDGGKIAQHLLTTLLGPQKGHRLTLLLGNLTAPLASAYFLLNGSYIFAYLFLFHGWRNYQTYTQPKPSPFTLYNEALQALEKQEHHKAQHLFKKLSKSKDDYIKTRSLEGLAQLLTQQGKTKQAYTLLKKTDPHKLNRGKWLLCKLAYTQGNYPLIEKFSQEIYETHPTLDTALLNAKTFAHLNNPTHSLAWLQTALQFEEAKAHPTLLSDPAFSTIRDYPEFAALAESVEQPTTLR